MASRTLFLESESDDDSVATDTTAESEHLEEYAVEKVLLEERNHKDNKMEYLIKWEGYPLSLATWEPEDHIDEETILEQWEEHKAAVAKGEAMAFNYDEYEQAVSVMHAQKEERARRREAKRARRRNQSSSTKTKTRSKKTDTPARKGQARVVTRRLLNSSDDSDYGGSGNEVSEDGSEAERERVSKLPGSAPRKTAPTANMMPVRRSGGSMTAVSTTTGTPTAKATTGGSKPSGSTTVGTTSSRKSSLTRPDPIVQPSMTAKASTEPTAKNKIAGPKEPALHKQRPRVDGNTPKQSTDPQFKKLSQMGRYQKYGAQNEPPPDVSKLVLLDPKTGKAAASTAPSAPQQAAPQTAPSVYDRRSPPREVRPRSPSPVPLPTTISSTKDDLRARVKTCPDWADGRCRFDADACTRAHDWADIRVLNSENLVCHFWRTGRKCAFSDQECKYAHYDTGYYKAPPGALDRPDRPQERPHESSNTSNWQAVRPKSQTTCWYWKEAPGGCRFGRKCDFAHDDTGHYASKPGALREAMQRRQSGFSDATASDANSTALGPRPKGAALPETSQLVNESVRTSSSHNDAGKDGQSAGASVTSRDQGVRGSDNSVVPRAVMQRSTDHDGLEKIASSTSTIPTGPQIRRGSRISIPSVKASIRVTLEGAAEAIVLSVGLEIVDQELHRALQSLSAVTLNVKSAVMASDFQSIVWIKDTNTSHNSGRILQDADHAASAQSIAELCKLTSSGLLAGIGGGAPNFVIYPATAEEWRFLTPADSQPGASDSAVLRFKVFSSIPGIDQQLAANHTALQSKPQRPVEGVGAALLGLDANRLLQREDGKRIDTVFLMLPGSRHLELEVFSRCFLEQGCNIYHSGTPGAWHYFMKKFGRAGLIIIHPEVRLESIPQLYDFTIRHGLRTRFFSIGINSDAALVQQGKPSFACTRLFPSGQALYLTDEALQYYPNDCREIIKLIKRYNDQTPAPSKVITRPNVKAWLLDLIGSTQDDRYVELYEAFWILCPLEDHDPDDMTRTLPSSSLLMIDAATLPGLAGLDETARSDYLVNWFAGWAVRHASVWRTFVICYEPKTGSTRTVMGKGGANVLETNADPSGWAKRYQNVGVVAPKQVHDRLLEKLPKS